MHLEKDPVIRSFIEGDHEAFAEIYRNHHDDVLRQISSQVRDPAAADDIAQEVFLKAHRFRKSYDPTRAISTWLRAIARNTVFDWFRKHGAELGHGDAGAEHEKIACESPCAESLVIRKSDRRQLLRMLRGLTRLQRRVIWLSVVHQLPYAEISKRLGLSVASVKCLVYRAKAVLAEGVLMPQPAFAGA
jgi:RNA polymerase sigma-70 factor (ECF subfamily)